MFSNNSNNNNSSDTFFLAFSSERGRSTLAIKKVIPPPAYVHGCKSFQWLIEDCKYNLLNSQRAKNALHLRINATKADNTVCCYCEYDCTALKPKIKRYETHTHQSESMIFYYILGWLLNNWNLQLTNKLIKKL